jgi:hypothetical protein
LDPPYVILPVHSPVLPQVTQLDSEQGGFGLVVSQRARQSILVPGNTLVNPGVARPLEKAGEEEEKK